MSFKDKAVRFLSCRNGVDSMCVFFMTLSFVLSLVNLFLGSVILWAAELPLMGYAVFRFLSKNVYKRRLENEKFLRLTGKIKEFFRLQKRRFDDRKTHVYRTCPQCKKHLRLPKKKGSHNVCCPCCKNNFSVKI